MLIAFNKIKKSTVVGADGDVGKIDDILFDENASDVRYCVIDTGSWLPGRRVLLSPSSIEDVDWPGAAVKVRMTQQQIKDSPHVDTDKPVSREMEARLAKHYQWPAYWGLGVSGTPVPSPETRARANAAVAEQEEATSQLRSAREVIGYKIDALDGKIGRVDDFIVDDEKWVCRYFVIDTGSWLPGKRVILATGWLEAISWAAATVQVDLSRDAIEKAPEFDPSQAVNRQYEEHLYDFYGREKYWV